MKYFQWNMIRVEKLKPKSLRTFAKIFGTLICVGGAVCLALYKGPKLHSFELLEESWIKGFLFLTGCICCWSLWLILQVNSSCWFIHCYWFSLDFYILIEPSTGHQFDFVFQVPICKHYLDPLSLATWMAFLSAIQSFILALLIETNSNAWKINSVFQLLSCLFVVNFIKVRIIKTKK